MAEKRDCYEVLGISKSASKDEIKSAYRKKVKIYHPDNKETGDAEKFKEVQEAYDILYDDQKRQTYDQFGFAAFEQGAGAGAGGNGNPFAGGFDFGGGGFEDIINSFFGGGQRRRASNGPARGQDRLIRIKIDFMDSVNGKDIDLPIDVEEACPNCHGTGAKTPNDIKTCPHCSGRGFVKTQTRTLFGVMENQSVCPQCGGTGKIITAKCDTCGGKGYVKKKKTFTLHIHPGIASGQQLRIEGYGERGVNGGPNGDLYVEVMVKDHSNFQRDGNDIHIEIPLDFVDAILGCKIDVPTVNGEASLEVPAGTQPNQILRMRGQGIKDYRTGKPGDQYVHFVLKIPTSLTKEQKDILNKYKDTTNKNDSFFERFKRNFKA